MTISNIPTVGQFMTVRGIECTIVKIWPLGTIDVTSKAGGRSFRVTGLYCKGWPK
jgi:hypothetical protein